MVCSACGAHVHSHCSAAVLQAAVCENCYLQDQAAEQQRRQHHEAARTLGLVGARGSEILGTAFGAVGAAGAAAGRFFVAGAAAGASSVWTGSRLQGAPPRIEVQLPRPAGLPPPLPAEAPAVGTPCAPEGAEAATRRATLASGAPVALESAEAATRRAEREDSDRIHRELEDQIHQLKELVSMQSAQQTQQNDRQKQPRAPTEG